MENIQAFVVALQAQTYLGVYYTEDDDNQMDFQQAASFFRAAASQNVSFPLCLAFAVHFKYCCSKKWEHENPVWGHPILD